jgi:hypothetical protein
MEKSIEDARERLVEQLMSDERLLGALPEDAARILLDRAIARLDDAAARAGDAAEFASAAEAIRAEARALAGRAAESPDPEAVVRFGSAPAEDTPEEPRLSGDVGESEPEGELTPPEESPMGDAHPSAGKGGTPGVSGAQPPSGGGWGTLGSPFSREPAPDRDSPAAEPGDSVWKRVRGLGRRLGWGR